MKPCMWFAYRISWIRTALDHRCSVYHSKRSLLCQLQRTRQQSGDATLKPCWLCLQMPAQATVAGTSFSIWDSGS